MKLDERLEIMTNDKRGNVRGVIQTESGVVQEEQATHSLVSRSIHNRQFSFDRGDTLYRQ